MTYEWAADNSTVTATRVCANDANHVETETVNTTAVTNAATCETAGSTNYTATFTNAALETQTKTVEIPALGHAWGEWTVTTPATCTEAGVETRICANDASHTETRPIEALGHAWGEVTYEWAADNSTVTATRVCANDANHIETETVSTTAVTNTATCETAGNTTYTATFENEAFEAQTKTVEIPATGHAWGEWTVTTPATCTEAGVETRICANDASHTETRAIEALGHAWGVPTWSWADGYTAASATFTCSHDGSHTHTVDATVAQNDCLGYTDYTATASFSGQSYSDTKHVSFAAFYLIGPDWTVADINAANKFEVNPSNAAEYMLTVDLTAGDQIKVVKVEDGAITAWYPDGLNNEYTVDAAHAGDEKTIYFSETYRNDWSAFGGYIWIDASAQVQLNTFTHSDNLVNVDTYLYRVGNGNTVKLGSLFKVETEGDSAVVSDDVSVTIEKVETNSTAALGSYTKNSSDWMQSTLKFTGEGPVKVTIKEGSGTPYTLNLEIVTAQNVTAYSELSNATCVLLNDITMTSNGQYSLANATLYGNGFVFDVKAGKYGNANGYESTNYVISLNNARLDNIQIVGKVYTDYGATRTDDYNFPCVLVNGGNCEIINSYISNCASPVRARGGASLYFENTTLKGGSFCNLDIRSGVNVTVNGLTTINQVNSNDAADNGTKILGLGIVFYYEGLNGDETLRITGNGLTQYNTVAKNQKSNAVSTANSAYNSMFTINSKFIYNDGTTQWVCTGILSLNSGIGSSNIDTPDGYDWQSVSMLGYSGYLCTKLAAAAQSAPDYVSTAQGPIAPGYSFEYPTAAGKKNYQAKTDGSSDYCYWDSTQKAILIGFAEGGSKNFDMDILTVTKNGCAITPTVSVDGGAYQDVSSSFAFTEEGEHILTYRYVDPYNYRYTDNQNTIGTFEASYTKTVKVTVTVAVASINPATFDFNGNGYRSVIANNTTYVMPNVSATATNSIGSKTIGGQTIYYPIVFTYYSTSENGSLTKTPTSQVSGSNMYTWCPIFDGVVTITDYDENSNQTTYGSSTTSMAEGKLICADSNALTTALTWMSASSPNLDPVTKNNKLYYRSTNASNNARSQKTYVIEYQYTDNAGNVYRYYIGYYFPDKQASCVAEGTQILMADGSQKAVEDVQMGDMVMTWSFENGCYEAAPVAIKWYHGTDDFRVLNLEFSDGTVVRVINTHGFFDRDLNTYAYIREGNADDYLGHTFVKRTPDGDNTEVVLVNSYITEERVGNYSLQTAYNDNFIAENLLTITAEDHVGRFEYFPIGDNMMYDAEAKARDIETYGLYTYEEFADWLTEEQFIMFNGPYFKVLVGRGVLTYEDILEIIRVNLYANETAQ